MKLKKCKFVENFQEIVNNLNAICFFFRIFVRIKILKMMKTVLKTLPLVNIVAVRRQLKI